LKVQFYKLFSISGKAGAQFVAAAKFLGVAPWRLRTFWKDARASLAGASDARSGSESTEGERNAEPPADAFAALCNLVRFALAAAAEGVSNAGYARWCARARRAGAVVGELYADRHFMPDCTIMASMIIKGLIAYDINQLLPGLGVRSAFALGADPVAIGKSATVRHDELLVICVTVVSPVTGRLSTHLFSARAMGIGDHRGDALVALLLHHLHEHPAGLTIAELRARCASFAGDGAMTYGGPGHRHRSGASADKCWRRLHPGADGVEPVLITCTTWDAFHRIDIAFWRAIRATPLAAFAFDAAKAVENMFGMSEGIVCFRGVVDAMGGESPARLTAPGGTRKVGYLSRAPADLLRNLPSVCGGLWARLAWSQAGHGNHTATSILNLARNISDLRFVVFLLLFEDVLGDIIRPYAMASQAKLEPVAQREAAAHTLRSLSLFSAALSKCRSFLQVLVLLRQHCTPDECFRLLDAFSCYTWMRLPHSFLSVAHDILQEKPTFNNVFLLVPESAFDHTKQMAVGPHCQCRQVENVADRKRWAASSRGSADRPSPSRINAKRRGH